MYTTKFTNKNVVGSSIYLNDDYTKKQKKNDRWNGKQFSTAPAKKNDGTQKSYFSYSKYAPEPYVTTYPYMDEQPLESRKLGFGTHDASKRSEFMMHIRTEQHREQLKKERKFENMKQQSGDDHEAPDLPQLDPDSLDDFTTKVSPYLFDNGRSETTPVCLRCSKETFYCPHRKKSRRLAGARLSSGDIGYGCQNVQASENGRVAVTAEFFDKGHLSVK